MTKLQKSALTLALAVALITVTTSPNYITTDTLLVSSGAAPASQDLVHVEAQLALPYPPPVPYPPPTRRPPATLQPSRITHRSHFPLIERQAGWQPFSLSGPYLTISPTYFSLASPTTITITTGPRITNAAAIEIFTVYSPSLVALITATAPIGHLSSYCGSHGYCFYWYEDEHNPITRPTDLYSLTFLPIIYGEYPFKLVYFVGSPSGARIAAGHVTATLSIR